MHTGQWILNPVCQSHPSRETVPVFKYLFIHQILKCVYVIFVISILTMIAKHSTLKCFDI